MNAITNSTREVQLRIPKGILRYGLIDKNTRDNMMSLDNLIITKVIRPHVMTDMNLYGGSEIIIPLKECKVVYAGVDGTSFFIPKSLTNFRTIVAATSLLLHGDDVSSAIYDIGGQNSTSATASNTAKLLNSSASVDNAVYSDITIIGENTVYIAGYEYGDGTPQLSCILENDAMLNNISTRSYKALGILVTLAVKAYIYNERVLNLNEGYIEIGHTSEVFKEKITEWSSAQDEYDEMFDTRWKKISFMNDRPRRAKFIRARFGSNT